MTLDKITIEGKNFWAISAEETIEALQTEEEGLSDVVAAERLEQFGENVFRREKKESKLRILVRQFANPLIIILIIAGATTILLENLKDGIFIFSAVAINAALGFYQENKAANALASLKTYIKEKARVIRSGNEKEVGVETLVPGDIIRLTAGTRVPADARVLLSNSLSLDESILTGESLPVSKKIEPSDESAGIIDRKSMVYGGTLVVGGVGLVAITATGESTELGKIAALIEKEEDEPTPLQRYIKRFSFWIGTVFVAVSALLFTLGTTLGYSLSEMFLISVAVAVSAVPEGLPIALTVALAIGVERLAKRKGVVRKLLAAEALGSTTLILTDKTGTLTEAKMELADILGDEHKEEILKLALLTVEATIENPASDPSEWRVIGRPLEASVVKAGAKYKLFVPEILKQVEVLERHPFNSTDKFSAVRVRTDHKTFWAYLGAPDVLLKKSRARESGGEELIKKVDELAYNGFRVLGVATDEKFFGLLAFNDPIRESVGDAIREVREAGVKTVIVTGDHKGTAIHVANAIGISATEKTAITGDELDNISDAELKKLLPGILVFARVTPEHKVRLTNLYKELGEVVAVTGDGVNDAPALEGADIGIAVGSGTDIARDASDLVILDDNFETIVAAIGEGRRIMANIKKIFVYLLSSVMGELFLIGGALAFGLTLPLNALQILWVNFFSDSFPSVALAFEKEKDGLKLKRHIKGGTLFDGEIKFLIFVVGILSSALLFAMYYFLIKFGFEEDIVRTFIFASFSVYTFFFAFSIKSLDKSIFKYNPFDNPYLVVGVIIGICLTAIGVYAPYFQGLLDTVSLSPIWIVGVLVFGLVNLVGVEFGKFLYRKSDN